MTVYQKSLSALTAANGVVGLICLLVPNVYSFIGWVLLAAVIVVVLIRGAVLSTKRLNMIWVLGFILSALNLLAALYYTWLLWLLFGVMSGRLRIAP